MSQTITETGIRPSDIISKAASAIERYGWIQRWAGNVDEGFCTLGACAWAFYSGPYRIRVDQEYEAYREALAALRDRVGVDVALWNDAPERQREEVVAMLRRIAATLEVEGK